MKRKKKYTEGERLVWALTFANGVRYSSLTIGEAAREAARVVTELRALAKKVTAKSGPSYRMLRDMVDPENEL